MDTTINNNLTPEQETTIQEQDVTKTNGAVDLNVLETQASDLPQAPVTNDMTASTLSVAENLNQVNAVQRQRAEEAQKEAQKQAMAQADQETIVRTLAGETLGQGAVETQAMAQAGIGKAQSEIDALDQAILNSSTALKQAMVQDERDVQSLAGQGRGIPASVVRGRQALLQSQRRADRKVEAIQLENDIATSELLQGKVDSAKKAIQRSVELQFADKRAELEIEQQFLSRVDTKEANARKEAIRREEKQMEKAQEEANDVFSIAEEARKAGAGAEEVAAIIKSKDRNEAIAAAKSLGRAARIDMAIKQATLDSMRATADAEAAEASGVKIPSTPEEIQAVKDNYQRNAKMLSGLTNNKSGLILSSSNSNAAGRFLGQAQIERFKGKAKQLLAKDTIDELIDSKKQGASYGSLTDGERQVIGLAASTLAGYAIYDEQGIPTGEFDATSNDVFEALETIQYYEDLNYYRATNELPNQDGQLARDITAEYTNSLVNSGIMEAGLESELLESGYNL